MPLRYDEIDEVRAIVREELAALTPKKAEVKPAPAVEKKAEGGKKK